MSFGTGKFEHEGLESRVNGFCYRFFDRGFEAVLEGFMMGFDVVNVIGSCLSSHGQGLGGVFKSCDLGIDTFHFFEVIRLEKGKLLLQISSRLDKSLPHPLLYQLHPLLLTHTLLEAMT